MSKTNSFSKKLTKTEVRRIYKMASNGRRTHSQIASQFGIDRSMVGKILNGVHWSSVTNSL